MQCFGVICIPIIVQTNMSTCQNMSKMSIVKQIDYLKLIVIIPIKRDLLQTFNYTFVMSRNKNAGSDLKFTGFIV